MSGEWISPLNRSTAHINGTHIVPHLHTSKGAKNKEKNAYRTSNTDRPTQIAKKKNTLLHIDTNRPNFQF